MKFDVEDSEDLPNPPEDLIQHDEDLIVEVEGNSDLVEECVDPVEDLPPPADELLVQEEDQMSAQTEIILDEVQAEVEIQNVSLLTEINQELSAPFPEETTLEHEAPVDMVEENGTAGKQLDTNPADLEVDNTAGKDKKKLGKSFVKRVKSFKLSNKKRSKRDELEKENRVVPEDPPKVEPEPPAPAESDNILIMTVVVLTDENKETNRGAVEKAEAVLAAVTEAAKVATQKGGLESAGSYATIKPPLSPTTWSEVRRQSRHRY